MEWIRSPYTISTDRRRLRLDVIHGFLARSYWASGRDRGTIRRSIRRSLCFGIYHGPTQVGFARVVSDLATFYWLCDVFVDPAHRGRGLGKWLVECVVAHPDLAGLKGLLGTRDAHGLYARYGFAIPEDRNRLMWRQPSGPVAVDRGIAAVSAGAGLGQKRG